MAEPQERLTNEPEMEDLNIRDPSHDVHTPEFEVADFEVQEPEEFDDEPEFELEDDSADNSASGYSDDILNNDPDDAKPNPVEPNVPVSIESEADSVSAQSAVPTFAIDESLASSSNNVGALSGEETESIELLLSESTEDLHNNPKDTSRPTQEPIEKIDTEVVELQHSLKSLHQQQAHQLEMSLLERVDDLIQVLEKRHKPGHSPEQFPHKQFATALHYISKEQNHYLGGKWLRKAAMQGHGKAQLYLGMLFIQGQGVPKSLFHAYAWFSLAVCQDIDEAKDARKKLERHLTAKEINSSLRYAADILDKIHQM